MASIEAVARRRAIRRLRSAAAEPTRAQVVESRRLRMAMALAWKHYRLRPAPDDLRRYWLFWTAVSCQIVTPADYHQPDFTDSIPWRWWCRLHYTHRIQLVKLSRKCSSKGRLGYSRDDSQQSVDLLNSITLGDVRQKW